MEIFGCTYKEYIKKYENRLGLYVERYEDRTESVFLEKELVNFKDFHNVLVSIHNSIIQHKNHINLINDVKFKNHLTYLQNNYNNVFKELFAIGPPILDANQEVEYQADIKKENVHAHIFYVDITKEKLDNFITSAKRVLVFINDRKMNIKKLDIPEVTIGFKGKNNEANHKNTINPYPQVFLNTQAFELFEKLHESFKETKNPLADYSFIYRKMYSDGFILETFKSEMFVRWIAEKPYKINLDKTKTLNKCTTNSKIQTYKTTKELLNIK